jgi:hypothetical protein
VVAAVARAATEVAGVEATGGIDGADRHKVAGVLGREAQIAVVGDYDRGVDLLGEDTGEQVCCAFTSLPVSSW